MDMFTTTRRDFIKTTGLGAAALSMSGCSTLKKITGQQKAQHVLPRWRGFNLLNFFNTRSRGERSDGMVKEEDFRLISDWDFDFVRLPMSYSLWLEKDFTDTNVILPDDVYNIDESMVEKVDRTVELGQKYGVHVSLNFHRGPGYCVNSEMTEPFNLWKDQEAVDAFCFHWGMFAKRYRAIPSSQLSFDLLNEPHIVTGYNEAHTIYKRVVAAALQAIHAENPDRLVIADGLRVGREPIPEMIDLPIAQSCRGYDPHPMSHYRASWVDRGNYPEPVWPGLKFRGEVCDREWLEAFYAPWVQLARLGVGVHCGECGSNNTVPHEPFLAWFRDLLDILTSNGIGYSIWELRGSFGILNSRRSDVVYEDYKDYQLDRKYLELLQDF